MLRSAHDTEQAQTEKLSSASWTRPACSLWEQRDSLSRWKFPVNFSPTMLVLEVTSVGLRSAKTRIDRYCAGEQKT
jgi:hypothetical protein